MNAQQLIDTAETLVADDKCLLAMDESNPTCNKRFSALGIPQTEAARRAYRKMIATTPALGTSIYDELTFSDARSIQQPAWKIWSAQDANVKAAQQALTHRARCNRAARRGEYYPAMERI